MVFTELNYGPAKIAWDPAFWSRPLVKRPYHFFN